MNMTDRLYEENGLWYFKVLPGDGVDSVAQVVVDLARERNHPITFTHNGAVIVVGPDDNATEIYDRWKAIRHLQHEEEKKTPEYQCAMLREQAKRERLEWERIHGRMFPLAEVVALTTEISMPGAPEAIDLLDFLERPLETAIPWVLAHYPQLPTKQDYDDFLAPYEDKASGHLQFWHEVEQRGPKLVKIVAK